MALTLAAATRRPLQAVTGLESVIAPTCALALLVHPTPLTWPALVVGAAPVFARWIVQGRPWRATPFDLPLALLIVSCGSGLAAAPNPQDGAIRFFGLVAALILFAWVREHAASPDASCRATVGVVVAVSTASLLLVHVAQPFLLLDRVPPLAALAGLMEPLGLYRLLSADGAALQRFRLYASGVGALAAVGLAMTGGLVLGSRSRRHLPALAVLGLWFAALLYVADNRGSMLAAAVALGCTIVWWRPRLLLLAVLFVFGTLDLMAFGMAQRGLSLRTVLERIDFWQKGLVLASETPLTGVGLGVSSVQLAYRAAFQPTNPPFNHAHNIFVQALLEQGLLGVVGLLWVCLAVARLGPTPRVAQDAGHDARHATRLRGASLALLGGSVALLAAGLTEIVALTTLGTALLLVMLGLLVAAHDAASDLTPVARVSAGVPSPPSPLSLRAGEGRRKRPAPPLPVRGRGGWGVRAPGTRRPGRSSWQSSSWCLRRWRPGRCEPWWRCRLSTSVRRRSTARPFQTQAATRPRIRGPSRWRSRRSRSRPPSTRAASPRGATWRSRWLPAATATARAGPPTRPGR
ncbi:MAG: O-antigen ligase family protein [Chloroflexota bacterium]